MVECKRPSQFQLLRAKKGITGVGLHKALAHWKQIHTGVSGAATPAQGGSCGPGQEAAMACSAAASLAEAAEAMLSSSRAGTLLVLRSQR